MPSNITEVSAFTAPVTVPVDGDARNAASVNGAFQALANRSKFLRDALLNGGALLPFLSSSGGNIAYGAFYAVINEVLVFSPAGTFVLSGLTPSTWYYLYAQPGVGVIASLVPPDDSRTWLNNGGVLDLTKRYLGAFYATGAAACRPFRRDARSGVYLWRGSALASGGLNVLAGGTAGSYTDISLAAWMPPHARVAKLRAEFDLTNSISALNFRTKGDTAGESFQVTGIKKWAEPFDIETDSARAIQYQVATAGTLTVLQALGFEE